MKLIDETFKKYKINSDKLLSYGFNKVDNVFFYSILIHNNEFRLDLKYENNQLSGKLIDCDFDDEFTQINIDSISGNFIGELKEECIKILLDIRENCCVKEIFIFPQTNRITKLIKNKYNVDPEFLWEKFPGCGVFRNQKTNKWFGLIMNINKKKLNKEFDQEIEILNLNLGDETDQYIDNKSIFGSYHMNKKHWVSVILDDLLNDEIIMNLIEISFKMSNLK